MNCQYDSDTILVQKKKKTRGRAETISQST